MALFKILKGDSTALKKLKLTEGYCYVTTDEGKFYVDITGTKRICLNAEEADKFGSAREIKLTGNVTGSASSDGESGWSIATTISNGAVTNAMLAGSIANNKLTNSAITIAGNSVSLGNSISATTLRESLGLSNAMHFVGIATVAITDGSTTDPSIGGYTTKQKGDVIIDKDSAYEYVWTGTKWERLGGDGSYKTVQTAVDDPTASGNSSTFIKTISQNENGVITATKATIANHVIQVNGTAAGTYNGGAAVTLNLKDGNGITVTNSSGAITFAHSNSVTAKTTYGSTTTTASANGGSITVTDVKYDAQGHITGSTDRTITLSQTTYTMAGLMGSTAKGSATLPVYWNGKAWAAITSYGGKASTAGTADKVAKSLLINGKSFDGSAAIDVGTLGISYGGTGATTASAALTNLGAAAANHTHSEYLPLAGGNMTGYINWGNTANAGLVWTTNNGTQICLRPYSPANTFQLTMKASDGDEFGAINVDTNGYITLALDLGIEEGGTGASDAATARSNLQVLTYKGYDNGYFETGAGNTSAWLQYQVSGETKCQMDLFSDGKVGIGGKTVLVSGDVIPYVKYSTNSLSMDSWIDNNAYTLALRDDGTDKCVLVMWNGGALTVNGSIVATEARDNTFAGTLTVSNTKSAGGYVKIWEDNEGGNIAIGSKSGKEFQFDAYNDTTLRCFAYDESNNLKSFSFNRTNGNLSCSGQMYCLGSKTVYHTGNIVYSSTQPTGSSGMIWLKPV